MVAAMNSGTNSLSIGSDWVGRVVDGHFTLQRWLGSASRSGVFLTQLEDPPRNAAIKLIPADAADADFLLAQWKVAADLSHPHLLRLFHAGRCRQDGHDLLYAVTEYSEEILGEILPARPLTPPEVREMLAPVLSALSWLHEQGLVHGGLKPSNLMVVDEKVKLSVDRVQPAGMRGSTSPSSDIHVAPDTAESVSPAADVWSLGVLIVEALTQHPPQRDGTRAADPLVPASVPDPFATIARECLRIYPARRCSLSEIRSHIAPAEPPISQNFDAVGTTPAQSKAGERGIAPAAAPPPSAQQNSPVIPARPPGAAPLNPPVPSAPKAARPPLSQNETVFATAALILIAGIAAMTFLVPSQKPSPPTAASHSSAPAPVPAAPSSGAVTGPTASGAVLHRVLPDVPRDASNTIRGHIQVGVRVQVDANGNVSHAEFDPQGPSRYFANLALDAARNWKFQPAQVNGRAVPSTWLLQFEFARNGTDVTPRQTLP
jgi:TonB family protein